MPSFDRAAHLYLIALLLVLLLQGAMQDHLLYHSDMFSYSYFTVAVSLLFCIALLAFDSILRIVLRLPRDCGKTMLGMTPLVLILTGFLVFGVETFIAPLESLSTFCAAVLGGLFIALLFLRWAPEHLLVLRRVATLSRATTTISILIGAGSFCLLHLHKHTASANAQAPRHLILIVIDSLPSQLLHLYRPEVAETSFDRLASQGRVFLQARSNRVYTFGWFHTLYTGKLSEDCKPENITHNLLMTLQSQDVTTRWISFHSNGVPETNCITSYRGFRSEMLTERYARLPAFLGLDYNIFLAWPGSRQKTGARFDPFYRLLNGEVNEDNLWQKELPHQIEELQGKSDTSFLLFHVSINKPTSLAEITADQEMQAFVSRAVQNDYMYADEEAPTLERMRRKYQARVEVYGQRIARLLNFLRQTGRLENTLVIVTADHGASLSENKVLYGYHINEETIRVPLFLFGLGVSGQEPNAVDTQDIAQTIINYFTNPVPFAEGGRSLLEELSPKTIPTLTIPSERRHERFLALYRDGEKYEFNLHPQGTGESRVGSMSGYNFSFAPRPVSPEDPIWSDFFAALAKYDLSGDNIHQQFRNGAVAPPIASQK